MDAKARPVAEAGEVKSGDEVSTEQKIFGAAVEVFARKGRDGTRMQEIADCAGINRALLHYYYRSKQRLYEAVFEYGFSLFAASFAHALERRTRFADALEAFIDGYIDFARHHPSMVRLMVNECISEGTLVGEHLAAAFQSGRAPGKLMEDRIAVAIQAGEIRAVDPKHLLLTIVSACLFPFVALPAVRFLQPQAREDFDRFIEARKRHVYDLVMSGLSVPESG